MARARTAEKPPAFQFYAQRWLASTAHFSPEAKGVMVDLMAWSWDNGPLPDDEPALARLGGVTVRRFRYLWLVIGPKWTKTDHGYVNARLEQCREETHAFLQQASEAGKAGAEKRWGRHRPAIRVAIDPPVGSAIRNDSPPISNLRSPDLEIGDPAIPSAVPHADTPRAREETALEPVWRPAPSPGQRSEALIDGAALRRHGNHAWCADRDGLCVPFFLHMEFIGKSQRTDVELKCWYAAIVREFGSQPIGEDSLKFWRNRFARWIGSATETPGHTKADRALAGAHRVIADIDRGVL